VPSKYPLVKRTYILFANTVNKVYSSKVPSSNPENEKEFTSTVALPLQSYKLGARDPRKITQSLSNTEMPFDAMRPLRPANREYIYRFASLEKILVSGLDH
jgi:hypothetical protein